MTDKYKRRDGIIVQQVKDQYLLCDMERGLFGELNPLGYEIWNELENGVSIHELEMRIGEKFDAESDVLRQDIDQFLTQLRERGFIEHG